ncbi:MAG TPA: triphosphoribosyl-dephospho-CoA synthase [Azospirillum sp.]|nr:triphosphoribosyl-dephospho-CoA synthase [Azospirillum sp.]
MPVWLPCPPDPATGIAGAYLAACQTELRALKPGNVHIHAAGHGMTVDQFLVSAEVTAPILAQPGLSVGERIHRAVAATRAAVGCNTNLGIILLAAPLAQAALTGTGPLRDRLRRVLAGLTVADAELTFRAIALAAPAGLGRVDDHDVHAPATVTLLAAMQEARERDRIAMQYATDYADVFETGMPRLRQLMDEGASCEQAAELLFLDFLATIPDSHVLRKYGVDVAERLRLHASKLRSKAESARAFKLIRTHLGELDRELKYNAINPGTTADIVVGCLFSFWLVRLT